MVEPARELRLLVRGMTGRHRVRTVTALLRDVPGVRTVTTDALEGRIVLTGTMCGGQVLRVLEACGHPGVEEQRAD